jgi:hypothetical protein
MESKNITNKDKSNSMNIFAALLKTSIFLKGCSLESDIELEKVEFITKFIMRK